MSWVTNAIRAFPDVEYRYAVFPTKKLPGTFVPLDFNPKHIEDEIQLGISDALELIRNN